MIASDWQQVVVADSTMRMHVSIPPGPFSALLVLQHQGGVDAFVQHTTRRLAETRYVAAAPDLYHRDGPDCKNDIVTRRSRLSDRRVTVEVDATVGFLQRRDAVDGHRLGIIGFCVGEDMRKLETEFSQNSKAHEFYSYPSAGHAFMDHTKESYRRQADAMSWPRTLEFLDRHLGPGVNCH